MTVSSSKNHFLVVDGVKMRSKKSAGSPKRKNDKAIASDSNKVRCIYINYYETLLHFAVSVSEIDEMR